MYPETTTSHCFTHCVEVSTSPHACVFIFHLLLYLWGLKIEIFSNKYIFGRILLENCNFEGYQLFHFSICAGTCHRFADYLMSPSASSARVEDLVFVFDLWDFEFDENCNLSSQRGFSAIFSLDFRCHFRTIYELFAVMLTVCQCLQSVGLKI